MSRGRKYQEAEVKLPTLNIEFDASDISYALENFIHAEINKAIKADKQLASAIAKSVTKVIKEEFTSEKLDALAKRIVQDSIKDAIRRKGSR